MLSKESLMLHNGARRQLANSTYRVCAALWHTASPISAASSESVTRPIWVPRSCSYYAAGSLRPLWVLYGRVAEHVAGAHLRVLDPAIVRVVDDDDLLGNLRHATALGADQRHGLPRPAKRFDTIWRVRDCVSGSQSVITSATMFRGPVSKSFRREFCR